HPVISALLLALGITLALSLNAHAALTPEQQARMEESIQRLRQSVSNMNARVQAFHAARLAGNLPNDLQQIAPADVPASTRLWWSIARWVNVPSLSNCWDTNADLYYSQTWSNSIFVDDRAAVAERLL